MKPVELGLLSVEAAPPKPIGPLSTSCNLFDFFCGWPREPNMFSGSAAAGWNELKKSSPPKSMSSFFAFRGCPWLFCLRANEIPPEGTAA